MQAGGRGKTIRRDSTTPRIVSWEWNEPSEFRADCVATFALWRFDLWSWKQESLSG